jgi:hypothetical protein
LVKERDNQAVGEQLSKSFSAETMEMLNERKRKKIEAELKAIAEAEEAAADDKRKQRIAEYTYICETARKEHEAAKAAWAQSCREKLSESVDALLEERIITLSPLKEVTDSYKTVGADKLPFVDFCRNRQRPAVMVYYAATGVDQAYRAFYRGSLDLRPMDKVKTLQIIEGIERLTGP